MEDLEGSERIRVASWELLGGISGGSGENLEGFERIQVSVVCMWCVCGVYVLRMKRARGVHVVCLCMHVCGAYVVFPICNFARWREPPRRPGVLLVYGMD